VIDLLKFACDSPGHYVGTIVLMVLFFGGLGAAAKNVRPINVHIYRGER
jgi:hypothetical protein